jgi:hypothetical protein
MTVALQIGEGLRVPWAAQRPVRACLEFSPRCWQISIALFHSLPTASGSWYGLDGTMEGEGALALSCLVAICSLVSPASHNASSLTDSASIYVWSCITDHCVFIRI